ncbi:T-cell surface glycoprotein CD2 [Microdochium nivale]|nr:T-cell surface glycoprotein CD2 [Microdochium nivale]
MSGMVQGDDPEGTLFAVHPMAWIIVPASIFIVAMVILTLARRRRHRRRALRAQWGASNAPAETAQYYPRPNTRPSPTSAPSWSDRARSLAGLRRSDQGLDEHGEAPPPAYTPSQKTARASMSTLSSNVPQPRYYGMPINRPPPMASMSFPMPGGPPTFHPMAGAARYGAPDNGGPAHPQSAVIR